MTCIVLSVGFAFEYEVSKRVAVKDIILLMYMAWIDQFNWPMGSNKRTEQLVEVVHDDLSFTQRQVVLVDFY